MTGDVDVRVSEALRRVRDLVDAQRPSLNLPDRELSRSNLQRFSTDLPDVLPPEETQRLRHATESLSPWLQGPFYLGGDVVVEGVWRNDERWQALGPYVPDMVGKRVLDVGSNAGYDPFMFHVLGAREVVACEPFEFIEQARFLESVYQTGVQFEPIGWQRLDPDLHGTFDLVHCNGVLYHEPNPLAMLERLRAMLAPDGQLLLGSMMLASAENSEYARFVRHEYAGDPTWWWVPGRLALRWMLDASGLTAEPLPLRFSGPRGDFEVINGYFRSMRTTPSAELASSETIRPAESASPSTGQLAAEDASPPVDPGVRGAISRGPVNRFPIGHYYSPMYDTRELSERRERLWPPGAPREPPGIDWREGAQIELSQVFARQEKFEFIDEPSDDPTVYHASNDQYPPLDAWALSGILRHFKPRRMIEVGCGFSTLVSARTNREVLGMQTHLTCIEPHPRDFLLAGVPGVTDLRVEKVEDSPLELFGELRANDVLFVDTSHTVKTGGDVTWIFLEVIPRLAPGVIVHIHDVFIPGEYPEPWVMEGWGWNETYLVQAFLSFNERFEILWGAQYMLHHHVDAVVAAFPGMRRYPHSGASLWIRPVAR